MLTFLHASWLGEKTCRAKSTSIREESDTQEVMERKTHITTHSFRWAESVLSRFRSSGNFQGCFKDAWKDLFMNS